MGGDRAGHGRARCGGLAGGDQDDHRLSGEKLCPRPWRRAERGRPLNALRLKRATRGRPLPFIDPWRRAAASPSPCCAGDRRSEERRVGKECVSTCRSRWSPYLSKKKQYNCYDKRSTSTSYTK